MREGFRVRGSGFREESSRSVGSKLSRAVLSPVFYAVLLSIFTSACSDPKQPKAIWLTTGIGPGEVVYPRAIAWSPKDNSFFIIDRAAHVQHLDDEGHPLAGWQMPQWKYGKPVGAAVGPDGNLYVPDTHYHRIIVYSPGGQLLRQWGSDGRDPGQFIYPTDVAFDSGRIFVSEYGDNDRVQVFDQKTGKWLYQFGRFGWNDGEFSRPQSMVIDNGLVFITDACNHRINVFTTDGAFVRNMGSVGSDLGQFRFPYGMVEDQEGHLIVCEFGNNRVQMIDKQTGRGLKIWGEAGHEPGQLAYPWGVAVDRDGRVLVVDAGNNRVQVFSF